MTNASRSEHALSTASHVAVKALFKSVLINMLGPALLYKLAAPHFPPSSLMPLAISGIPPILWLAYGIAKLRAIDFLGFFAAENVVVSMAALVLAHTERGALLGRSVQNVLLAAVFLASVAFAKPLMFYMSRQLSTGNDPATRQSFERTASQPNALAVYRALTWGWVLALLIKAAGSYYLAAHFSTKEFLVFSPLWDLVSDSVLVTCSILYGRAKLGPPADGPHLPAHAAIAS